MPWNPDAKDVDYEQYLTDGELLAGEDKDVPYQLEAPKRISLVTLPPVSDTYNSIRSGMHADKLKEFVGFLGEHPRIITHLLVEGRILNKAQWAKLSNTDVAYRFFVKGRADRALASSQSRLLRYLVPKDMKLTVDQVDSLMRLAYSPGSSTAKIGHKVGWFNAKFLYKVANESWSSVALSPLLEGVNQFRFGSDDMESAQVKGFALSLRRQFALKEENVADKAVSLAPGIVDKLFDQFEFSREAKRVTKKAVEEYEIKARKKEENPWCQW